MSSAQQKQLISEFQAITGVGEARAKTVLQGGHWNLEAALSYFFDHPDAGAAAEAAEHFAKAPPITEPIIVAPPPIVADWDTDYGDRCGLFAVTTGHPIPVQGLKCVAEVNQWGMSVEVHQRYKNNTATAIEAVFLFDYEAAHVASLEVDLDGRKLHGQIKDSETAAEDYDDAIAQGGRAVLLEKDKQEEVFRLSVGNLAPGKEATVTLRYVSPLTAKSATLRGNVVAVHLPITRTAVEAPPREAAHTLVAMDLDEAKPLEGLDVELSVNFGERIQRINCPTHPIDGKLDGTRAVVKLRPEAVSAHKGLMLEVELAGKPTHRAIISTIDAAAAATLKENGWRNLRRVNTAPEGVTVAAATFYPVLDSADDDDDDALADQREIVFLVDRSGSMAGSRITQARNALQLFLRSLPVGAKFNIFGFGSSYQQLFPLSQEYNQASLQQATAYVDRNIKADLAGTDILNPLRAILTAPSVSAGGSRQVFILTDGDVTNTPEVLRFVRGHVGKGANGRPSTRIFTLGIGAEASKRLVRGIARLSNGEAEFVESGERIEGKVLAQLARALQPQLTGIEIDWGELKGTKQALPPAFPGQGVTAFTFLEAAPDKPFNVTLTAKSGKRDVKYTAQVTPLDHVAGPVPHLLAAGDEISALESAYGNDDVQGDRAGVKAQAIKISLDWGLASNFTSYIVTEDRPAYGSAATGPLRQIRANTGLSLQSEEAPAMPAEAGEMLGLCENCSEDEEEVKDYRLSDSRPKMKKQEAKKKSAGIFNSIPMPGMNFFGAAKPARAERESARADDLFSYDTALCARIGDTIAAPAAAPAPAAGRVGYAAPFGFAPQALASHSQQAQHTATATTAFAGFMQQPAPPQAHGAQQQVMRPLDALVLHQTASGCFIFTDDLIRTLGINLEKFTFALGTGWQHGAEGTRQSVLSTAIALAYLEKNLISEKDQWQLLADKSRKWLRRSLRQALERGERAAGPSGGLELRDTIEELIETVTTSVLS